MSPRLPMGVATMSNMPDDEPLSGVMAPARSLRELWFSG